MQSFEGSKMDFLQEVDNPNSDSQVKESSQVTGTTFFENFHKIWHYSLEMDFNTNLNRQ